MTKETGGSAFPHDAWRPQQSMIYDPVSSGMSLRDWFAGMALQGLNANPNVWEELLEHEIIEISYRRADAMLKERLK